MGFLSLIGSKGQRGRNYRGCYASCILAVYLSIVFFLFFYSISNRSFSPMQKAKIPAFGVVVHGAFFRALFRAGEGESYWNQVSRRML